MPVQKKSTKRATTRAPFLASLVLTGAFALLAVVAQYRGGSPAALAASNGPVPPPSAQVEQDTADFLGKTSTTDHTEECQPVHIRDEGNIGVLYLYCSEQAYKHDGEAVDITPTFHVPESIARRYNFWRRVYSLWTKDHYVMHLAEYPEVIVEVLDGSHLDQSLGPVARENRVKKLAKSERELYRKLFLAMHQHRDHEERFTPAMKRLALAMAHIPDHDKYLTAYQSLRLQRGQRDFIASGLLVAPRYLPSIEQEFQAQGIPKDITRLAFVESSFNLKAQSKVGASGVYQIMPATGRQYLKMFSGVDERNDPIKASRAAAKLLRLNYNLTGSWPLAITAYNHGVGGIRRATAAVHSKDIVDLINRYQGNQFGFASKNFYASFLGVLATLRDSSRIFPEIPPIQALAFTPVRLPKATSARDLCKKFHATLTQLAMLNPDITHGALYSARTLPAGYVIKVPPQAPGSTLVASVGTRHHAHR